MTYETKIINAVAVLEQAKKSIGNAMSVNPENDYLAEAEALINNAIVLIKIDRYSRPHNKDCLNCANSFVLKDDKLVCMIKLKAAKPMRESIVQEDGYCEEWN
jgi:hypothetical protein